MTFFFFTKDMTIKCHVFCQLVCYFILFLHERARGLTSLHYFNLLSPDKFICIGPKKKWINLFEGFDLNIYDQYVYLC